MITILKELWKPFNGLGENKPADLFWKCQNKKDSWKSGALPYFCLEDLLCASPSLSANLQHEDCFPKSHVRFYI